MLSSVYRRTGNITQHTQWHNRSTVEETGSAARHSDACRPALGSRPGWNGWAEAVDTDGVVFGLGTIETISARHRIVVVRGRRRRLPVDAQPASTRLLPTVAFSETDDWYRWRLLCTWGLSLVNIGVR